jgi:hypothetical protein
MGKKLSRAEKLRRAAGRGVSTDFVDRGWWGDDVPDFLRTLWLFWGPEEGPWVKALDVLDRSSGEDKGPLVALLRSDMPLTATARRFLSDLLSRYRLEKYPGTPATMPALDHAALASELAPEARRVLADQIERHALKRRPGNKRGALYLVTRRDLTLWWADRRFRARLTEAKKKAREVAKAETNKNRTSRKKRPDELEMECAEEVRTDIEQARKRPGMKWLLEKKQLNASTIRGYYLKGDATSREQRKRRPAPRNEEWARHEVAGHDDGRPPDDLEVLGYPGYDGVDGRVDGRPPDDLEVLGYPGYDGVDGRPPYDLVTGYPGDGVRLTDSAALRRLWRLLNK